MIRFLRRNQQIFILFIFLYGLIAVYSLYFIQPYRGYGNQPFRLPFLMDIFQANLTGRNIAFLFSMLITLTLIFNGFYLVRMGINYLIITQRSQFSALFLITISIFPLHQEMYNGASIASLFLLFILDRVIGSMECRGPSYRFLDAGLLLGLGSLFYFNLIFLLPFLWIAQWLLRPFSWREQLYTLVGLGIPVIYLFSGYFLINKPIYELIAILKEWVTLRKIIELQWHFMVGIGFYLLMMLVGSFFALRKFAATKIQSRKLYQLLFFLFINLLIIVLLVPSAGLEILFLMAVPSAVLLSIYFTECRNSIVNRVIFLILLVIPIALNLIA